MNIKYALSMVIVLGVGGWLLLRSAPNASAPGDQGLHDQKQVLPATRSGDSAPQVTNTSTKSLVITPHNFMHQVTIITNFGEIVFQTYDADAPKTVENFITLAKKGFYNNLTFHRIIKNFMIQGGDPSGNGSGGPGYSFADELNLNTESGKQGYKKGVVAMANAGPNTNGSQFFIVLQDLVTGRDIKYDYTIFGKVVKGQDVVDKIGSVSTGANDRPNDSVMMKSVIVGEMK